MIIKRIICLVLIMCYVFLSKVYATDQDPERIVKDGVLYLLLETIPIEEDSALSQNIYDELETLRGSIRYGSSSCHRDYWGYWSIEDGHLYLDSLNYEPYNEDGIAVIKAATLKSLQAYDISTGRVLAQWYTGRLTICRGRMIRLIALDQMIEFYEDSWNVFVEKGHVKTIKNTAYQLLSEGNKDNQALREIGDKIKKAVPDLNDKIRVFCNGGVFDQQNKLIDIRLKVMWPQDAYTDDKTRQEVNEEIRRLFLKHQMVSTYLYEGSPLTEWMHWEID